MYHKNPEYDDDHIHGYRSNDRPTDLTIRMVRLAACREDGRAMVECRFSDRREVADNERRGVTSPTSSDRANISHGADENRSSIGAAVAAGLHRASVGRVHMKTRDDSALDGVLARVLEHTEHGEKKEKLG